MYIYTHICLFAYAAQVSASSHCCYRVFVTSAPWISKYVHIYIQHMYTCIHSHAHVCMYMLHNYPQAVVASRGCLLLWHHGHLNVHTYIYIHILI